MSRLGANCEDIGIVFEDGWESIDKVLHPQTHLYYSSKPPLLPVIAAGEYWLLQKLFGWRIEKANEAVVCTILLTINAVPFAIYLVVFARLIERFGRSDWGRLFTFTAACFATYFTIFSNTFNNHTVAAYTALFAVAPLLFGRLSPAGFAISGLFAGLTAAFELPATAFAVALGIVALSIDWRKALLWFAPAACCRSSANWGSTMRSSATGSPPMKSSIASGTATKAATGMQRGGCAAASTMPAIVNRGQRTHFICCSAIMDVFSLTPIWLLPLAGFSGFISRCWRLDPNWYRVTLATAAVSVVVIVFFAAIVSTVNYGGWTSGPRWFFWLTPLWLLTILPVADCLGASRIGRGFAYVLLAFSVFSVSFVGINPWRHPWIYQAMEAWGWKGY